MPANPGLRLVLGILGACVLLVLACCGGLLYFLLPSPEGVTATYGNRMSLSGRDGSSFPDVSWQNNFDCDLPVPRIFLQIGDSKTRFFLPDLTPERARELFGEPEQSYMSREQLFQQFLMGDNRSRVEFRGRHVHYCYATSGDRIAIASSSRGPFYQLPITKRQMIELFGRPSDYTTSYGKGLRP